MMAISREIQRLFSSANPLISEANRWKKRAPSTPISSWSLDVSSGGIATGRHSRQGSDVFRLVWIASDDDRQIAAAAQAAPDRYHLWVGRP